MMDKKVFMPVETARLLLRPFRADDAQAFADYRSDPQVALYQGWNAPFSLDQARDFIGNMERACPWAPGEWHQVAIELRAPGILIGDVGVHVLKDGRQGEIGFTLAAEHQDKGYALEAVSRIIDYMVRELGLHRVQANCDPRNVRSVRLLERLGMRREGHTIVSLWYKGLWVDELWYAILGCEWKARVSDPAWDQKQRERCST